VVFLLTEAVTRHSLQAAHQSSVAVCPSQRTLQPTYERPRLPDYEMAVRRLNERRRQTGGSVLHSRVHSLDSTPAEPN